MITKTSNSHWYSLFLAACFGPPLGALLICSLAGIFGVTDPRSLWSIVLGDALFITLVAYPFVVAVILVYAMPILWVAQRFRFANPITALVVALLPGLMVLTDGTSELMNWIPLAICLGIAPVFIVHAYRRPSNVA
jgi:hypothetical protein